MQWRGFQSTQRTVASFILMLSFLTGGAVKAFQKEPEVVKYSAVKQRLIAAEKEGQFKVVYSPVKNPLYNEIRKEFVNTKAFEEIAIALNELFIIPTDLTINVAECGQINAFYDPNAQQITLCYELMEYYQEIFADQFESEDEISQTVVGATLFTFFHELGHALIDVLELPTTGKEEDAVDELATVILALAGDEGEQSALAAAHWFLLEGSKPEGAENSPFWDEHSLDMQRFYGIVCLLYGSNQEKYASLVQEIELPESRAQRCESEYTKKSTSWLTLIAPYVRE